MLLYSTYVLGVIVPQNGKFRRAKQGPRSFRVRSQATISTFEQETTNQGWHWMQTAHEEAHA